MSKQAKSLGDDLWKNKVEKISGEFFALTYGALVAQLIKETSPDKIEDVNRSLERIGYRMGTKLIEEFLSKTNLTKCPDFVETAEIISKIGFKMFLGISPSVLDWSDDKKEFSLQLDENPLVEFLELPQHLKSGNLLCSNLLCGVIRGALEMVQILVEVQCIKCLLQGDGSTVLRVKLLRVLDPTALSPSLRHYDD